MQFTAKIPDVGEISQKVGEIGQIDVKMDAIAKRLEDQVITKEFNVNQVDMDNAQKKKVQDLMKNANCQKLAWNYRVHAVNGIICAEKEINIWIRGQNGRWKRIHHVLDDLTCTVLTAEHKQPSDPDNYVSVDEKGVIQFKGGYLKIEDPGLIKPLANTDVNLGDKKIASKFWLDCKPLPDSYDPMEGKASGQPKLETTDVSQFSPEINPDPAGKNIHLEVEFESERRGVANDTVEDSPQQAAYGAYENLLFHPIFFFPQNSNDPKQGGEPYGQIYFGESIHDNQHIPYWGISHSGTTTDRYELDESTLHQVIISHDANRKQNIGNTQEPYFEFFANSIGLKGETEIIGENHFFGKGERIFYVGYAPAKPEILSDGVQFKKIFRGGIRRIFFDPNSTCPTCH